jgi:hypothetical protein
MYEYVSTNPQYVGLMVHRLMAHLYNIYITITTMKVRNLYKKGSYIGLLIRRFFEQLRPL